jgi:pimeloyl-ACP methyl ester carboxylesterase
VISCLFLFSQFRQQVDDTMWSPHSVDFSRFQFKRIKTNGIELNVIDQGPQNGTLLVLLHGFPETALLSWHHQIEPLVAAGYHVIAPDQRGYNTSDKPRELEAYVITELVHDVIGLLDHFKSQKAIVIGHDWGAMVAWSVAIMYPERVEKLAILNVPHPDVFLTYVKTHLSQLRKSWYIFFFQIPYLPEFLLSRDDFKALKLAFRGGSFSKDEISKFVEGWSQEYAVSGMLNWYRASLQKSKRQETPRRVRVPTQIIWGEKDIALESGLVEASVEQCDNVQVVRFTDASHWVQHDLPAKVTEKLIGFLKSRK